MLKPLFLCEDYLVSDEGYILSKRGRKLKPSINHKGYKIVNLMIDGKRKGMAVHTAIMMTFKPHEKINDSFQVNHIDGDKENNHIDNLEWVTPKQNMRHSVDILRNNVGENHRNAKAIRGTHKKNGVVIEFATLIDGGRFFNHKNPRYGQNNIHKALSGRRNSAYGYIWEYI